MATITLSDERFGRYECDAATLDLMIARHLPASPAELRALVAERAGVSADTYRDHSVSALLVMLGDWHDATQANERAARIPVIHPDAPSVSADVAALSEEGWSLVVSDTGAITATNEALLVTYETPELSQLATWVARAIDADALSEDGAGAMLRLALTGTRIALGGHEAPTNDKAL